MLSDNFEVLFFLHSFEIPFKLALNFNTIAFLSEKSSKNTTVEALVLTPFFRNFLGLTPAIIGLEHEGRLIYEFNKERLVSVLAEMNFQLDIKEIHKIVL